MEFLNICWKVLIKYMKNSFLNEKIIELNTEYISILENIKSNLYTSDNMSIVDEINVFWFSKKALVQFILGNIPPNSETYIYTGAVHIDTESKEHFPFASLGKYHIFDDPVCSYARNNAEIPNTKYKEKMKGIILNTIECNLKILRQYSDVITILPVRLIMEEHREIIFKASEQAFLGLFNVKEITMKRYFSEFDSIQEIEKSIDDKIKDYLIFSKVEEKKLSFQEKFTNFKNKDFLPIEGSGSDAEVFYFAIFSRIAQATDIIMMCINFGAVPYVRDSVSFAYIQTLMPTFESYFENDQLYFRSIVAHIWNQEFDLSKVENIEFLDYYQIVMESKFSENLFLELEKNGVTSKKLKLDEIINIIKKQKESLFLLFDEK